MTVSSEKFRLAAADYALLGVDVEAALNTLAGIPISIHCWQGDDVIGFDGAGAVSGGIQATRQLSRPRAEFRTAEAGY